MSLLENSVPGGRSATTASPAALESHELAEIAAGLGRTAAADLIQSGDKRRWSYAIRSERYEAVVIAWPPGAGLRMHDHGGSLAAIYVTNGRLRERYLDSDGRERVRWLSAGETTELPGTHVHEVINLDDAEVVSVHVYSPPLDDDSFRVDKEIDITAAK
jgi:quercetin dioxygenase-like cupin family protein